MFSIFTLVDKRPSMTARQAITSSTRVVGNPYSLSRVVIPPMSPLPLDDSKMPRSMEAGPSKSSAAGKWFNPLGPPPGSSFGARMLKEDQDVYSQNAW